MKQKTLIIGCILVPLISLSSLLQAEDFWDEWPPDEGDCKFCPPILAGNLGGEIEWGVEHVGFSIDEEIWDDLVELAEKLIDKVPGPSPDPEPEPEPEPEPKPEPKPDDNDGKEESKSAGRIVTLVETTATPQVVKQGNKYHVIYKLPRDALRISDKLIVTKAVRLLTANDRSASIIIPRGKYTINNEAILRVPITLKKRK
ncbi:MAG: hypothetical protein KJO91_04620 [Gammaproteobacteria bacterium]|nr:hypothetical protein [Gammaproteobacteria bacterium]